MTVKEFVEFLQNYIREELIAVSEVNENLIKVRFIDGQLINIEVK